jgi:glycosyltransferase involved in cell wall biosynthesis
MKIAILHYAAPPVVGGVESVIAHHARLMAEAGHEVTVFAGRGQTFDNRIRVRILPRLSSRHPGVMDVKRQLDEGECGPAFDHLREQIHKELAQELQGFTLLIAHNVASLNKNLALTAALRSAYETAGFPRLILWHHDLAWATPRYRHELHNGYPWDLLRVPWNGVAQVTVSELRRTELMRLWDLPGDTIRVIPNGVDFPAFFKLEPETVTLIEHLRLLEADPLLLLPVRLTPRKNIELALYVLSALRKQMPQAMLLVTGPEGPHNPKNAAYKRELLSLRDELQLRGCAHFLAEASDTFLPDNIISDLYQVSDALLFPSREEGFGIPLIEAAFSKMPVFCADIPVLRELGREDVSYFDPAATPAEIALMIETRLQADATSRWSRRARRGYTWEQIYRKAIDPMIKEVTA